MTEDCAMPAMNQTRPDIHDVTAKSGCWSTVLPDVPAGHWHDSSDLVATYTDLLCTATAEWLAHQQKSSELCLRPLFAVDNIRKVHRELCRFVARLHLLSQGRSLVSDYYQAEAMGLNMLLTGISGVGKTQLTRGIVDYLDAARTSTGVIGVYVDYEDVYAGSTKAILPAKAMHAALCARLPAAQRSDIPQPDVPPLELVQRARDHKLYFFLVFDEIQQLYHAEGQPGREVGRCVVQQLYNLGKNCLDVATIITGSTRRAKRYAFKEMFHLTAMGGDHAQRVENYSDLNNSVFAVHQLLPVRARADLERIFPNCAKDQHAQIYYVGGGVERYLQPHASVSEPNYDLAAGETARPAVHHLLFINELLVTDLATGRVSLNVERVEQLLQNPWSLRTQNRSILEKIIAVAHYGVVGPSQPQLTPLGLLSLLEDCHIFYSSEADGRVGFLRAADAVKFAERAVELLTANDDMMTQACYMVLATKAGNSKVPGTHVERDMIRRAATSGLLADEALPVHAGLLSFAGGKVCLHGKPVTLADLPRKVIVHTSNDFGTGGIWLDSGMMGSAFTHHFHLHPDILHLLSSRRY